MTLNMISFKVLKEDKGIALLEVLVSIVILTILIVVLCSMFSHGIAVSSNVRNTMRAMDVASSNLDRAMQILAIDFNASGFEDGATIIINASNRNTEKRFICPRSFECIILISSYDVFGVENFKTITSKVNWQDKKTGNNHTVRFTTSVFFI